MKLTSCVRKDLKEYFPLKQGSLVGKKKKRDTIANIAKSIAESRMGKRYPATEGDTINDSSVSIGSFYVG